MPEISIKIVEIKNLKVYFNTDDGEIRAVDGVTFDIPRGKVLALVGESGCGKSVTAYSILKLIQKPGRIAGGEIIFNPSSGKSFDISSLKENSPLLFRMRGEFASMIFQEPMTALSPVHTIGNQICEAILLHQKVDAKQAREMAIGMLNRVGIPGAEKRIGLYPFEMSGGMRQRAMIAMAMVCSPELLIADEPTTALDVTIQAQILQLMRNLQRDTGTSLLLITHDLGVVAQMADEVAVMYLGRILEQADVREIMKKPLHPYTKGLLESLPSLGKHGEELPSIRGSVPSLTEIPCGCPFHPRCPYAVAGRCDVGTPPPLEEPFPGRRVSCLRVREIDYSTKVSVLRSQEGEGE